MEMQLQIWNKSSMEQIKYETNKYEGTLLYIY